MAISGEKPENPHLWHCIGGIGRDDRTDVIVDSCRLCWLSLSDKYFDSGGCKLARTLAMMTCSCSSLALESEGNEDEVAEDKWCCDTKQRIYNN